MTDAPMVFWTVTIIFVVANGLLAWEATFKSLPSFERPSVLRQSWFRLTTPIGAVGWLAVPAMFYSRYGFIGSILSAFGYIVTGLILAFALKGAIEASINP